MASECQAVPEMNDAPPEPACPVCLGDFVKYKNGLNQGAFQIVALLKRTDLAYRTNYLAELRHAATGQILLPAVRCEMLEPLQAKGDRK